MSYRLLDANALNGVISNDDYEKILNAPCIFADLPNGLDGGHYNLHETVLDKIRADIQNGIHHFLDGEPIIEIKEVLQIIDKYKAESEE